jgi:hypothetical protein
VERTFMSLIIKNVSDFVEMSLQLYPPFRWDEDQEKAWGAIMARELGGFSPAALDRGFAEMVRSRRKETRTPSPGECLSFCSEAKRWLDLEANDGKLPGLREHGSDEWSTERQRLAYDLVHSAMGKQAAADDPCWVRSLWAFCRKNQRMPSGHEIEQCKQDARSLDEGYRDALRGETADLDGVMKPLPRLLAVEIQKLGASMLAKREKLRAEVLGR